MARSGVLGGILRLQRFTTGVTTDNRYHPI